jgi:DNA-binding MarR family transcriptional regulator
LGRDIFSLWAVAMEWRVLPHTGVLVVSTQGFIMGIRRHFCSSALTAFVAVAETGCIAHAARRLHLTPSAVSKRLQLLESDFGRVLIERSAKPIIITPIGRRLLHAALQLRDLQSSLLGDLQGSDDDAVDVPSHESAINDALRLVERTRELLHVSRDFGRARAAIG